MKIVLSDLARRKIQHWVAIADGECSGFGSVEVKEDYFYVPDVYVVKQVNGAASTELLATELCKLQGRLIEKALEECGSRLIADAKIPVLKYWWHSHVNMGVFKSGTDDETLKSLGRDEWIIASVFNKKKECLSWYYAKDGLRTPFGESPLFIDNVKTELGEQDAIDPEWTKEFKAAEEKPAYTPYSGSHTAGRHNGWGAYSSDRDWGSLQDDYWEAYYEEKTQPQEAKSESAWQTQGTYQDFDSGDLAYLQQMGYDKADVLKMLEAGMTHIEILEYVEMLKPTHQLIDAWRKGVMPCAS